MKPKVSITFSLCKSFYGQEIKAVFEQLGAKVELRKIEQSTAVSEWYVARFDTTNPATDCIVRFWERDILEPPKPRKYFRMTDRYQVIKLEYHPWPGVKHAISPSIQAIHAAMAELQQKIESTFLARFA